LGQLYHPLLPADLLAATTTWRSASKNSPLKSTSLTGKRSLIQGLTFVATASAKSKNTVIFYHTNHVLSLNAPSQSQALKKERSLNCRLRKRFDSYPIRKKCDHG
jgi:hypothetical protein